MLIPGVKLQALSHPWMLTPCLDFSSKFLSYGNAASQVRGLPNLFLALQTPASAPAHPGGTNKDQ